MKISPANEAQVPDAAPNRRGRMTSATAATHVHSESSFQSYEDRKYRAALAAPEVTSALRDYECAQTKRDSISRKLCGGSTQVNVSDLTRWEASLAEAKTVLAQLAERSPVLTRHQILAAAVGRG